MLTLDAFSWWRLSPLYFDTSSYISAVWGEVIRERRSENDAAIRPSLSLVSSIKISSGDGTATNPYKVITE